MSTQALDPTRQVIETTKTQILSYLKTHGGQTFGHLVVAILEERMGYQHGDRVEGTSLNRILDRALQKLRKVGKIEFVDRQWKLSQSGWTLEEISEAFTTNKGK